MRMLKLLIAAAIVVVLAWVGLRFLPRNHDKPVSNGERVVAVTEGPVEQTIESTGYVVPLNRVEIKPPIQGRIEELLVEEGNNVQAGQILAWMSSTDRAAILDAARAKGMDEYKRWQDVYKPTPIVSPISGVVILRNVVAGQTVDPSTVLYAVSDELIVIAQVDESDIGHIREGMSVRITLDAYPDRPVQGTVFAILHEGKNVSNVIQYGVKIRPQNIPPFFRSQMTANISFVVNNKENAVLIPAVAVREGVEGGKYVLVPASGGKSERREIQTGIDAGDRIEIVSGLRVGDEVLLKVRKYVPQKGPESSPLTFGGRPPSSSSGPRNMSKRNN